MTPNQLQSFREERSKSLRRLRENLDITKKKLIQLSGLSYPIINRIESGCEGWSVDSEIIYTESLRQYENKRVWNKARVN
jgi:predicted transcriptional regulator